MEEKELNEEELEKAAGGKQTARADQLGGSAVPDKKKKIRQSGQPG